MLLKGSIKGLIRRALNERTRIEDNNTRRSDGICGSTVYKMKSSSMRDRDKMDILRMHEFLGME